MLNKLILIINTVRHLKPIQVFYQLWYRVKSKLPFQKQYQGEYQKVNALVWRDEVYNLKTYQGNDRFNFINLQHQFTEKIDWNYTLNKKLWTYNLNYFDFLNQEGITKEEGVELMTSFVNSYDGLKDGKEPYPTSLRIINWVKFISKHQINVSSFFKTIKKDAERLSDNLEYHLLANHLLENGFALWFAAHLFEDEKLLKKGTQILKKQLKEQVLIDGGHFELSPMYHQLMLYRVLDCIQLSENNSFADKETMLFLREKASKMTAWLHKMTFKGGEIPLFNDAANGINPTSAHVLNYATALNIEVVKLPLSESGYRKLTGSNYEMIVDIGQVGPSYQPGHVHADTFNFELFVNNLPIIVDSGTSTYNIGVERSFERSTKAHNTVTVNDADSSQVWSGFRVAKRAKVFNVEEKQNFLSAKLNGYQRFGVIHQRTFENTINEIVITDELIGKETTGKAYFHLHPSVVIEKKENQVVLNKEFVISFDNHSDIKLLETSYSSSFNVYQTNTTIEICFHKSLQTTIKIK